MASTSSKLFLYAGVACVKGEYKVRFANDEKRIDALRKDGQEDVRLVNLPEPMTKEQSIAFIKTLDVFEDEDAQAAFTDFEVGPVREGKPRAKVSKSGVVDKTKYTYAGISRKNDTYAVRFANDCMRYAALERDGQLDIRLQALPEPMSKYDAVCHIMSLPLFDDEIAQQTLDDFLSNAPVPVRAVVEETEVVDELDEELANEFAAFADLDAELNPV